MKINVKPLSVNQAWQGRRFKTTKYLDYEKEVYYQLPNITIPKGKKKLNIIVGLSSKNADIDNFIKPFLDILQKRYGFNDKEIYKLNIEKKDVDKHKEYIKCDIFAYSDTLG